MTETSADQAPKKRPGGLNGMLLADLKAMAGALGIDGAGSMKKAQLVEAIKGVQTSHAASTASAEPGSEKPPAKARTSRTRKQTTAPTDASEQPALDLQPSESARPDPREHTGPSDQSSPSDQPATSETSARSERSGTSGKADRQGKTGRQGKTERPVRAEDPDTTEATATPQEAAAPDASASSGPQGHGDRTDDRATRSDQGDQGDQGDRGDRGDRAQGRRSEGQGGQQDPSDGSQDQGAGDGEGRSGRNRRRRGRERNRAGQPDSGQSGQQGGQGGQQGGQGGQSGNQAGPSGGQGGQSGNQSGNQGNHGNQAGPQQRGQQGNRHEPDTTILEDDIVVPAAGILDVLDNYAFVRTSGYLPGPDDVYLSLSMVRKFGLRRGDAIVGQVRHPREGERREKFNPMVRIDSVNANDPEMAKTRAEFAKLTPLHPSERLRLETDPTNLIGRVLDLAAPIGKGQRGLIVSPASAGKTTLLQSVAASISANNPECHLMVVLVDERPEEVTDYERSVKGEVIASTFDRPASDHTTVAELAIERAKRLVELGHDVVVLLDGLTRLGRAYAMALPATGRVLPGGVDATALHPPKRFFGAARNIENGGSLTILATAQIESGSALDEAILEEFQGTSNLVVRLRSELAGAQLFPAVDVTASGTRREDLVLGDEELAIVWKVRRALAGLEGTAALERLLDRLRRTHSNIEFLTQVQRSSAGVSGAAGQEI